MHPELFTLPVVGLTVKTYGFCLMVGFLSAVWLAMRRAERVKASADTVLDLSFFALIFGVGGARAFYVIHYWQWRFADASNKLLAIVDITEGGLEFLGGLLGATVAVLAYTVWTKRSIRLYLDILAPSAMWGLAIGRLGCFFNGCCFGGMCVAGATGQPALPWAVEFPFASPAHYRQWEEREVTVPAELIGTGKTALQPWLVPGTMLSMSVERRERPRREYEEAQEAYQKASTEAPDSERTARLKQKLEAAERTLKRHENKIAALRMVQRYPSRQRPTRATAVSELEHIAASCHSRPVHPTQLYSSINALLLSGVLAGIFYIRKRHGVVIAALFLLYPIPRTILELIRVDNPHDVGTLTASQAVSLGMFIVGLVSLFILYKWLPERSPALAREQSEAKKEH
ncbi:MAG: prolipoprotein diacylglyceryl transferase [Phycisphaerae bacterium]|jgi:phosphatidylglycerol:prolipoprotein diacylglycerol transferase